MSGSRFQFSSARDRRVRALPSFDRLCRPTGQIASLEIQDRMDMAKAAGRLTKPERDRANREAAERSKDAMWDAVYWARRVRFTPAQEEFAAMAALMLRASRGPGNVTRQMVLSRCQARYPDLFGELSRERVA